VEAEALGFHRTGLIRKRLADQADRKRLGFILQSRRSPFYRELGRELSGAAQAAGASVAQAQVLHLDDLSPRAVAAALRTLAEQVDAVALVAADHPLISEAIRSVSAQGVPVFALVSDLPDAALAGYVGIDHRKVGRSAAWALSNLCRTPGPVGLILGSHRYLCQEQCEVSFRSWLRECAPDFPVLETLVSLENTDVAQQATLELLHRHPDLVGIYVAGGGIEGVVQALQETRRPGLVTVCHDLTEVTQEALNDGRVTMVLSHPRDWIAARVVQDMIDALDVQAPAGRIQTLLPFTTYTAANT
jgi:LacI family transcriptional regulator